MRSVLRRRGWRRGQDIMWYADRSKVGQEEWDHDSARGEARGRGALAVLVTVLPGAADARRRAVEWAEAVASRHGDVSPAEIVAEALAWWDAP